MKSYLKIYLKFALFILITFMITSLIMAGIISFIHLSNFIYHTIINLVAGIIIVIWNHYDCMGILANQNISI
ncbi:MAG: hypothetical protein V8R64_06755 [Thomasclavelia sp.]